VTGYEAEITRTIVGPGPDVVAMGAVGAVDEFAARFEGAVPALTDAALAEVGG
jgi:hypothetical protein